MLVSQVVFRRNFFRAKLSFGFPDSRFALRAKGKGQSEKSKGKTKSPGSKRGERNLRKDC
jgi:hypothetical protein